MEDNNKKIEDESETQEIYRDNEKLSEENEKIIISKDLKEISQIKIHLSMELSTYSERFTSDLKEKKNQIIPENVQIVQCIGMWNNMIYPDNDNKERRIYKLSNDLSSYVVLLSGKAEKLNSLLTILHQMVKKIREDLNYPELKEIIKIPVYEEFNMTIPLVLKSIVEIGLFYKVTTHVYKFVISKWKNIKIPFTSFKFVLKWASQIGGLILGTVISGVIDIGIKLMMDAIFADEELKEIDKQKDSWTNKDSDGIPRADNDVL
ncbi:2360_t:CDS:2 [Dentiscutata heterogama]|uniref:2360_t:CDS:1 n=1 Tax=Dentiscutata heterogama TaxID=1316150 RepID=A0ACA9NCV8_9GLOM|nr:2360_t:CDS:2 [Dentiscutata heterogama]